MARAGSNGCGCRFLCARGRGAVFALCLAAALCAGGAAQGGLTTEIASVSSSGTLGNGSSYDAAISADGRFAAFDSSAPDLVPVDTNGRRDVFVHDRLTGRTERVSVSSFGEQATSHSYDPAISADGRYVAFLSEASNVVAGDTNYSGDIFVHDRLTCRTERVSVSDTGAEGDQPCFMRPAISPDGRYVAFESTATNLVAGDTNGRADIFVRDRVAGTTERVSVSSAGEQANSHSYEPSLSADGRYVAFDSHASNLVPGDTNDGGDVFVRDRVANITERVSVSSAGEQGNSGSDRNSGPGLSADGRYVAFASDAGNLVAADTNGREDVFLRDRVAGTTERVSVSSPGEQGNSGSLHPSISADGRYVAFHSYASNLVSGDTSAASDVLVRDRVAGTTERVSLTRDGDQANDYSYGPSISGDGRLVAFSSDASNLVPGDLNRVRDVFVRHVRAEETPPETVIASGPCGMTISVARATICWTGSDNDTWWLRLEYSWRLDGGEWQEFSSRTCAALQGLAPGAHTFEVKARDADGNEDASPAQCQFTVDLAGPQVVLVAPKDGDTVKGTVLVFVNAAHPSGIQQVEFYVDGVLVNTDDTAPYYCEWDTRPLSVAEGPRQVCAKAYANGGASAWTCARVTVDNTTFEDVAKTSRAWPYVEALAREGIAGGCSLRPLLFCPDGVVNRAQMAKFLCMAAGKEPLDSATPKFADVPKSFWAYGYVERLADGASWGGSPVTNGCRVEGSNAYYCPGRSVTREQMAVFLCAAAGQAPMPSCLGTFADVRAGRLSCPYVERLADAGSWPNGVAVTGGCGRSGSTRWFCPEWPIQRGDMAVFLVRAFGIEM